MIRSIARTTGACIGLVTALSWTATSYAQDTAESPAPAAASPAPRPMVYLAPNGDGVVEAVPAESDRATSGSTAGALLFSGFVTFGLSYIPAVTIAGQSRLAVDSQLYIPLAGPWIDFASRPACGGVGGISCTQETTNKALLVADGFVQALAFVQVLAGLASISNDMAPPASAKIEDKPSVHVAPTHVGSSGYGLAAIGRF